MTICLTVLIKILRSYDDFETFYEIVKVDGLVKSRKVLFSVIPAKAGIQCFQKLMTVLDPGFRRGDDFLRDHQG